MDMISREGICLAGHPELTVLVQDQLTVVAILAVLLLSLLLCRCGVAHLSSLKTWRTIL